MSQDKTRLVKTTKKDFKLFVKECERWIDYLGINDWQINIVHDEIEDKDGLCSTNYACKWAYIIFAKHLRAHDYNIKFIKELAAEEIFHLFLSPLREMCERRNYDEKEASRAEHEIIRRLYNSIKNNKIKKISKCCIKHK